METAVKFNRCLYAQLVQQQFEAPRHIPMPDPASPSFPAASLGLKLTAGFEILCSQQGDVPPMAALNASTDPPTDTLASAHPSFARDPLLPVDHAARIRSGAEASSCTCGPDEVTSENGSRSGSSRDASMSRSSLGNDLGWQAFRQRLVTLGWYQVGPSVS